MSYSAYFAERAEHYRKLAMRAPDQWQAECQSGLANLFLAMSRDMSLRELIGESRVYPTSKPRANDRMM